MGSVKANAKAESRHKGPQSSEDTETQPLSEASGTVMTNIDPTMVQQGECMENGMNLHSEEQSQYQDVPNQPFDVSFPQGGEPIEWGPGFGTFPFFAQGVPIVQQPWSFDHGGYL